MQKLRKKTENQGLTPFLGFTLIEMLVVVAIMGLLAGVMTPAVTRALESARISASTSNLRQLAAANLAYAVDHGGSFAPAQEPTNRIRWHGGRSSSTAEFDPAKGFLAEYLGEDGRVGRCPLFLQAIKDASSWEEGTGGYGYNAVYIGGTPADKFTPSRVTWIPHPSRTVMFTTTGFAKAEGVQEYPYTEPYAWVDALGNLHGRLQPSTHFRAGGKALVAWADGHVTRESPNAESGPNYYGGENQFFGWFGPTDQNGFWNPGRIPTL